MAWLAAGGLAVAKPGGLDPSFAPQLRASAAPGAVTVMADGRAWLSGGFDEAGGQAVGDLLVLGPDGDVEREGLPGYLRSLPPGLVAFGPGFQPGNDAFPLLDGSCLIPGGPDGWLRVSPAGEIAGKAFADLTTGQRIAPRFEKDGKIFVIRQFADGRLDVEKRDAGDGSVDSSFVLSEDFPADPVDAAPAADDGVWVLGASPATVGSGINSWPFDSVDHALFLLDASGNLAPGFPKVELPGFRSHVLVPGPDGAVRVAMGPDQWAWNLWPAPQSSVYRIEWYEASGALARRQDFRTPLGQFFIWAEDPSGRVLAADPTGKLVAWLADGTRDSDFNSPGRVTSVASLPGGKWLIDGSRRLLPNGDDDPSWITTRLDRPAAIQEIQPMSHGRMLVAGDFTWVDGAVKSGLAVLRADGTADPGFVPDPRIGRVRSTAVRGNVIHLVTDSAIDLGPDRRSNLVKLNHDGSIDETFEAEGGMGGSIILTPGLPMLDAAKVHTTAGGKLLVERIMFGGDVTSRQVVRLNSDGSRDSGFAAWSSFNNWADLLALKNGQVVIGDQWLSRDGSLIRDLADNGTDLRPLCEWRGGVLFVESQDRNRGRLKLWKGKGWSRRFQAAEVGMPDLLATPGEAGTLYVQARFSGSRPMLRRLLPNGRIDPTYRAPLVEYRARRNGEWWQLDDVGPVVYRPSDDQAESSIAVMRWSAGGLWVGGAFNQIDGEPRDGLARIRGGSLFSRRR